MNVFVVLCCVIVAVSCHPTRPDELDDQSFQYFFDDKLEDESTPSPRKFEPETDLEYYLYTRKNPIERQRIYKGDLDSLAASNFDSKHPIKFVIHGLGDQADNALTRGMAAVFFNISDANLIALDWNKAVNGLYTTAVKNTVKAGPSIGAFLDWLGSQGASYEDMHIMGFSIGGQLAGCAARSTAGGKVGYVTGLDPAGPLWGPKSQRLRSSDAAYVEVLHTNGGILGTKEPLGHNDFYFSGGVSMPGCGINFPCSHKKAFRYLENSIDNKGFMATSCASLQDALDRNCTGPIKLHMGGVKPKPAYGIFGLEVDAEKPYYKG